MPTFDSSLRHSLRLEGIKMCAKIAEDYAAQKREELDGDGFEPDPLGVMGEIHAAETLAEMFHAIGKR